MNTIEFSKTVDDLLRQVKPVYLRQNIFNRWYDMVERRNIEIKRLKENIDAKYRIIEEKVLFDVLSILYFQDYNRACDYIKMSAEEIVKAQHKVLKEIEKRYNYDFNRDILP